MAVPANSPNPSLESPKAAPSAGKINAAAMLNRKITEIDCAISSSSASMTGAVAAMAEPPQMEEPTPIKMALFVGIFKSRKSRTAMRIDVVMVARMMGRDCLPFSRTTDKFMPKPSKTTAYWRIFLDVNAIPGRKSSFPFINGAIAIPIKMAQTGPPTTGKSLPKNQAGMEMARQIRSPAVYFFIVKNSFPVRYHYEIMGTNLFQRAMGQVYACMKI